MHWFTGVCFRITFRELGVVHATRCSFKVIAVVVTDSRNHLAYWHFGIILYSKNGNHVNLFNVSPQFADSCRANTSTHSEPTQTLASKSTHNNTTFTHKIPPIGSHRPAKSGILHGKAKRPCRPGVCRRRNRIHRVRLPVSPRPRYRYRLRLPRAKPEG